MLRLVFEVLPLLANPGKLIQLFRICSYPDHEPDRTGTSLSISTSNNFYHWFIKLSDFCIEELVISAWRGYHNWFN